MPFGSAIVCAAGHYTDLITANLYGGLNPSADTINNLYRFTGKPLWMRRAEAITLPT